MDGFEKAKKIWYVSEKVNVDTLIGLDHYPSSRTCVKMNVDDVDEGWMVLKKQKNLVCVRKSQYDIFKAFPSFVGLAFQENVRFQNLKYFGKACELRLKCIT